MDAPPHTPAAAVELRGFMSSNVILRRDSEPASTALKLARHIRTKGLRWGSGEQVAQVLELMKFAENACDWPLLCPANMHSDHNFQDPCQYADSLVLLARDVDAHPWGAFGYVHPAKYLPFLQQLAGDLMEGDEFQLEDEKEAEDLMDGDEFQREDEKEAGDLMDGVEFQREDEKEDKETQ